MSTASKKVPIYSNSGWQIQLEADFQDMSCSSDAAFRSFSGSPSHMKLEWSHVQKTIRSTMIYCNESYPNP